MHCPVIAETKLRDENLHQPDNARALGLRRGGLVGAARTLQGRGPETLGACEGAGGKRWEPGRAPPCPASAGRQGARAGARTQTPEEPGARSRATPSPTAVGQGSRTCGSGSRILGECSGLGVRDSEDAGSLSALGAL